MNKIDIIAEIKEAPSMYDFVSRNYSRLSKEELKDLFLELSYALHEECLESEEKRIEQEAIRALEEDRWESEIDGEMHEQRSLEVKTRLFADAQDLFANDVYTINKEHFSDKVMEALEDNYITKDEANAIANIANLTDWCADKMDEETIKDILGHFFKEV